MHHNVSLRLRVTLISGLLLVLCCVLLTISNNYYASQMADRIQMAGTLPLMPIQPAYPPGTADAAIIDYLMAVASTGEGSSYENLTYTVSLADEQYGVGFRKGSDLAEKLNEFFAEKYADGTMQQVAEKYGIAEKLVEQP